MEFPLSIPYIDWWWCFYWHTKALPNLGPKCTGYWQLGKTTTWYEHSLILFVLFVDYRRPVVRYVDDVIHWYWYLIIIPRTKTPMNEIPLFLCLGLGRAFFVMGFWVLVFWYSNIVYPNTIMMGDYKLPGIDRSNRTIQPFLILLFMTLPWNWSHIMTPVLAVENLILVIRIQCL